MCFDVTINLPAELESRLRRDTPDLDELAKEALLIDLFRRRRLTHFELSQALGFDRIATDAWLKKHAVFEGSTSHADADADRATADDLFHHD